MAYWEARKAETKYGKAEIRPQDQFRSFLVHLRQINTNSTDDKIENALSSEAQSKIQNYVPPISIVKTPYQPLNVLHGKTKVDFIDEGSQMTTMLERMTSDGSNIIGVDFEFHKQHSYNGIIALVQIATWNCTYIIDPFVLHKQLTSEFCDIILKNENIVKIMLGCENDALFCQANWGSFIIGVLDLQDLYNVWKDENPTDCFRTMQNVFRYHLLNDKKYRSKNLTQEFVKSQWMSNNQISFQKLVEGLFWESNVHISKDAQHADWRIRPLNKLVQYAADDSFYLLRCWEILRQKVSRPAIKRAFEMTKRKLTKTFSLIKYPSPETELARNQKTFNSDAANEMYKQLHKWRDALAKVMDESPNELISFNNIYHMANDCDRIQTLEDLEQYLTPNVFVQKQRKVLLAIVTGNEEQKQKWKTMECHNCFGMGHQGWSCPHPHDPSAIKALLNRPENAEKKRRQDMRRATNWAKKTGIAPPKFPGPLPWKSNS